jgi:hypothetical protein
LAALDDSLDDGYKSTNITQKFRDLFQKVSGKTDGRSHKVALRMTRGPTNNCIDFHCDGGYATSTSQIPLNSPSEYSGGQLCFFVNDQLQFVPRPRGSLVQHPPSVLHGVTAVTEGTRKSLFIVDQHNGLGENGVVELSLDDVVYFLAAHRALGKKSQREEEVFFDAEGVDESFFLGSCAGCGKFEAERGSMSKCSGCYEVAYCSREVSLTLIYDLVYFLFSLLISRTIFHLTQCQVDHWRKGHKKECKSKKSNKK